MFMFCSHDLTHTRIAGRAFTAFYGAASTLFPRVINRPHLRLQVFQLERQQSCPRLFQCIRIFQARTRSFCAQTEMSHAIPCLFDLILESIHQAYPFQL